MSDFPPPSSSPRPSEPTWGDSMAYPMAAIGAMVGAAVGAVLAVLAARYGFYAVVVVGVMTGVGVTLATRRRGVVVALIAAIVALAASLCTEAHLFPFVADDSLGYFLAHLGSLTMFSLLTQAANAVIAGLIAYFR